MRGRDIDRGRDRGHAAAEVPPNRADEASRIIQTRQSRMKVNNFIHARQHRCIVKKK